MECTEGNGRELPRLAVLIVASLAIVASAFARADAGPAATSAANAGCDSPKIGYQGPITGDAAFIGKEQLGFAQYAIKKLGGGKIKLSQQDTQLDPAQASTTGTKLHADASVLAVVGPAGSQEVLAVAPIYKKSERLPFISGSATRTSLTNGSIPNFFRVVPNDSVQAPTTAKFLRQTLKAKQCLHRRRPDGVLEAARERRAGEPAGRRRQGDAELGQPEGDRLLVARLQDRR